MTANGQVAELLVDAKAAQPRWISYLSCRFDSCPVHHLMAVWRCKKAEGKVCEEWPCYPKPTGLPMDNEGLQ